MDQMHGLQIFIHVCPQETGWAEGRVLERPQPSFTLAGSVEHALTTGSRPNFCQSGREKIPGQIVSSGVQLPACSSTRLYGPQFQLHSHRFLCAWLTHSFLPQTSEH